MIPKPRQIELIGGEIDARGGFRVLGTGPAERRLARLVVVEFAQRFQATLEQDASLSSRMAYAVSVHLCREQSFGGAEDYELEVRPTGVRIVARGETGWFYALQTLLQLTAQHQFHLPCQRLSDGPRFAWRGVHLDVARHFYPVEFIERFIDLAALHKLNVFHWHLTDDQGWRLEVEGYPRLTETAAWRGRPEARYGGYYTKEDVRAVVAYAAERHVTVLPEIEMPGHAVAALAAYPELSCTGGPFQVESRWGVFDDVFCAGQDATFEFLEGVLEQVLELFPSPFIHIGGDECRKVRWQECAHCKLRLRSEGLRSFEELQGWFVRRIGSWLSSRGRGLIGWDEILEGGLPPRSRVMAWRSSDVGIAAAREGHDVIMAPTSHCYLDYRQSDDPGELGATYAAPLTLEQVYAFEPISKDLTPEQARHVLGVQGNAWTEWLPTAAQVEYMTFPRLCAIAEIGWCSGERQLTEFLQRWESHRRVLDSLGVRYRGSGAPPLSPRGR